MSLYLRMNEAFGQGEGVTDLHAQEGQKQNQWFQKKKRRRRKNKK